MSRTKRLTYRPKSEAAIMQYALEHLTASIRRPRWKVYGVCGNSHLLRKIKEGQPSPKNWRIRPVVARPQDTEGYHGSVG